MQEGWDGPCPNIDPHQSHEWRLAHDPADRGRRTCPGIPDPPPLRPLPTLGNTGEKLGQFAAILMDLDRCKHGRHEGDDCISCGGHSAGNVLLNCAFTGVSPNHVQIGYGMSGDPIVLPVRDAKYDPRSWRPDYLPKEKDHDRGTESS